MSRSLDDARIVHFAGNSPESAYEAVTRSKVEELAEDVKEIRARIDGMFWLIAGSVVVDVVLRAIGVGR